MIHDPTDDIAILGDAPLPDPKGPPTRLEIAEQECESLREKVKRLGEILIEVEWSADCDGCPSCKGYQEDGHEAQCVLAEGLALAGCPVAYEAIPPTPSASLPAP